MSMRLSNCQFYVPSGYARPIDLFGLALAVFGITFIVNFIDALFWTNSLRSDIFPLIRFLIFVWLVLLFILAKAVTKILKIRRPGFAFFISFAMGVGGYLSAWWLVSCLHSTPLSLFQVLYIFGYISLFGSIFNHFWSNELFIAAITMALYAVVVATGVYAQSSLPFNEELGRWFKKLSLPVVSIRSKGANKAMNNIVHGEFGDFVRKDDYSIIHTYNPFFYGCLKFDINYDTDHPDCYITVNRYRLPLYTQPLIVRNARVSKCLARAIRNKIVCGSC